MKTWNDNQASQRILAPIQRLASYGGVGATSSGNIQFRVPNVDVRLRMNIAVYFAPVAGSNLTTVGIDIVTRGRLWLFEEQEDRSGVSGIILPCNDIEGTTAVPLQFPVNAGLLGYAREFVTLAPSIGGVFSYAPGSADAGSWILDVTYGPEPGAKFDPAEWEQLASRAAPQLITPAVTVP